MADSAETESSEDQLPDPPAGRPSWWLWPNLVAIDAPIVAVVWLFAFAKAFSAPVEFPHYLVLFLCVWCLYIADRLLDAAKLKAGDPSPGLRTHRHHFMYRNRRLFALLWFFLAFIGGLFAISQLERPIFGAGLIVFVGAAAYFLTFVAPLGNKKPLPGKEIAGGLLFAAGTTVPVFADYSGELPVVLPFAIFAGLCALNLLLIASREGDLPQSRGFSGFVIGLGIALALAAAGLALFGTNAETAPFLRPLFFVESLAAMAMTILQFARPATTRDSFRVLADVALLTPLIPVAAFLG